MKKSLAIATQCLSLTSLLLLGQTLSAAPDKESRLDGFDFFKIGMPYQSLVDMKAACDKPRDTPDFQDSLAQGVASTVCPTSETFAMATLVDDRVASVAVNWVSWDIKKLKEGGALLGSVASNLRKRFGIPTTTIAYAKEFGNHDADALCASGEYTCQIHVWKGHAPNRVANLVYAKNAKGEIPLLFNISDLEAEEKIVAKKLRGLQTLLKAQENPEEKAH